VIGPLGAASDAGAKHLRARAYPKGLRVAKQHNKCYVLKVLATETTTMTTITVRAAWDPEAKVWYIEHSSLPGLHIEAETPLELYDKLPGAIEDLLEGGGEQEVSFEFIAPGRVKIAA